MGNSHHNRRAVRQIAVATTILAAGFATPAMAQINTEQPTPPPVYHLDANGVDLVTGRFYVQRPGVSIGGNGGGLSFSSMARTSGSDAEYLTSLQVDSSGITVSIGRLSDHFPAVNQPSDRGTGAALTGGGSAYTYTTRNGTVYQFTDDAMSDFFRRANQRAETITYPDGRVLTLSYEFANPEFCKPNTHECFGTYFQITRLASVDSTDGYRLSFGYETDIPPEKSYEQNVADWVTIESVTALNRAVPSSSWPSVSYTWNSANTIQTTTDALGNTSSITYSGSYITGVRPASSSSNTITIGYDANHRVHTVTRAGAGTWTYVYSDSGTIRTTTITDPESNVTTITSDLTIGMIKSIEDALNHTTTFEYYPSTPKLKLVTYPEGNSVEYVYDARDNVTSTVAHPKSGTDTITTSATYPASCTNRKKCNKPTSTTDANGNVTNYEYNAHGQVTKVTHPAPTTGAARPEERYTYSSRYAWYKNSGGTLVQAPTPISKLTGISQCITGTSCAGTANEVKTTIAYGTSGTANNLLPTQVTKAAGNGSVSATTKSSYDALGNVVSVDGPLSGTADTTTYRYDLNRQRTGVISPDPDGSGSLDRRAVRTTYADDGQVSKVELGTVTGTSDTAWAAFVSKQQQTTTFDAYGRPVKSTLTAGGGTYGVTQTSYDTLGRPLCTVVRMNSGIWNSQPDACAATTAGAQGPDRITRAHYDEVGRVDKITSGYDVDPIEETATYTPNGKLASLTDGEGNLTHFFYDRFDRLSKTQYPLPSQGSGHSSTSDYEQLVHDDKGNITSRRLRDGQTITYTYDDLDRLTTKNLPGTEPTATYAYDNLGRPTSVSQGGTTLSFGYDALSRLLTQTGPQGTMTSTYDAAGRRTKLEWDDGFTVNYDHLVTGEVTKVRENGATSGIGVLASYSHDDLGNRIHATYGNGTASAWSVDPVGWLKTLVHNLGGSGSDLTRTYSYNPASQIIGRTGTNTAYDWDEAVAVTRNYTANGLNQYTAAGGVTFGYDARGNLTTSGSDTFAYTSENLLKSGPGVSLAYDPLMRLAEVTGSTTTKFAYDGLDLVAEYNSAGTLTDRYVFGPGTDEPIVWYHGSGTTDRRWLHADERGSIVAVTDDSGAALGINTYDEYGIPGAGNIGRFQYTGQTWLPELGMYYYKARIYSPTLGRFMQTDPIGYADGLNWYNYVGNDPINFVDPMGLMRKLCGVNKRSGYSYVTPDGGIVVVADQYEPVYCEVDPGPVNPRPHGPAPGHGKPDRDPKPQSPQRIHRIPCGEALREDGTILTGSVTGAVGIAKKLGVAGSVGYFVNVKTGTQGIFASGSIGGVAGSEVGIEGGVYKSLSKLAGNSTSLGLTGFGLQIDLSFGDDRSFLGGGIGLAEGVEANLSRSNTQLLVCYR